MKLIVVRHGETPWNTKNKLQGGEADRIYYNELNRKGKKQAKELASVLKERGGHIDLIISSPLRRAKGTAKIIGRKLKVKDIIYDSRLKDRGYGEFSGTTRDSFGDGRYQYKDFWDYVKNVKYDNGAENIKDFESRIQDFLDECCTKYPDKTILLVMHVSGTKMVNCLIGSGIPPNGIISGNGLNNGEIAEYTMTKIGKREKFLSNIDARGKQIVRLRGNNYGRTIKIHRIGEK